MKRMASIPRDLKHPFAPNAEHHRQPAALQDGKWSAGEFLALPPSRIHPDGGGREDRHPVDVQYTETTAGRFVMSRKSPTQIA